MEKIPPAGPKATDFDIKLVKAVQKRLRKDDSSDNDKFGKPVDAYEAIKTLDRGGSVVFEHASVGSVEKGRYPERRGKIFRGSSSYKDDENAAKVLRADYYRGEGVRVRSYLELRELVAVEHEDWMGALTEPEKKAAAILRGLEGGSKLNYTVHDERDDFGYVHYYTSDGVDHGEIHGLFDPQHEKGGFLGLGSHPDRLTAYEALCKLRRSEPVMIRVRGGRESTVSGIDDLLLFDELK